MRVYFTYFVPYGIHYYTAYHITTDLADVLSIDLDSREAPEKLKGISENRMVEKSRVFMPLEVTPGVKDKTQALFCSHIDMIECDSSLPYYGYLMDTSRAPAIYKGGLSIATILYHDSFNMIHVVIDPRNPPSTEEVEEAGEILYKTNNIDYLDEGGEQEMLHESEHLISMESNLDDGYYHKGVLKKRF